MRKLILLAIFKITVSTTLYCQSGLFVPGYIVKQNGDTIAGFIREMNQKEFSLKVEFSQTKNADNIIKVYKPTEIKSFGVGKLTIYQSFKIELPLNSDTIKQYRFLLLLIKGFSSLYSLRIDAEKVPFQFYLKKADDPIIRLPYNSEYAKIYEKDKNDNTEYVYYREKVDRRYTGIFRIYFSDCPEVLKNIDKLDYKTKDLIKLVSRYNNIMCPDKPEKNYIMENSKSIFNSNNDVYACNTNFDEEVSKSVFYGIKFGCDKQNFRANYDNVIAIRGILNNNDLDISLLAFIEKKLTSDFSIIVQTGYTTFKSKEIISGVSKYYDDTLQLNFNNLELSFLAKYQFGNLNIRPYLDAGFVYNRILSQNNRIASNSVDAGSFSFSQNNNKIYNAIGLNLGFGLYMVSLKYKPFIEIFFKPMQYMQKINQYAIYNGWGMNIGLAL